MPVHPGNFGPTSLLRRRVLEDRFTVLQVPGMYRAVAGALGNYVAGEEVGAAGSGSPAAFLGTIGQTAAVNGFSVLGRHSCLFTATNLSGNASTLTLTVTTNGLDLDGYTAFETMTLATTNASSQSKSTSNIYSRITSIKITTIDTSGGGTVAATGTLGIGHGVSTVAGNAGCCRFPLSPGMIAQGMLVQLVDPNGLPVVQFAYDLARHCILNASGTTLVAGEYVIKYQASALPNL